jgi:hypothetical protein
MVKMQEWSKGSGKSTGQRAARNLAVPETSENSPWVSAQGNLTALRTEEGNAASGDGVSAATSVQQVCQRWRWKGTHMRKPAQSAAVMHAQTCKHAHSTVPAALRQLHAQMLTRSHRSCRAVSWP